MQLRRRVLLKMIESRHMPIRKELEANLFGDAVGLYDYWIVLRLSGNDTNIAEKIVFEYAHFAHTLPQAVVLPERERSESPRPFIGSHWLHSNPSSPHSFEATRDARRAARHNQVTAGVEDLKRNCIGELVRVVTDLDNPRQPVCLRPGARGAKNEGLGHRAVSVAVRVPPDTQAGSAQRGELACGRHG